jgi:hypothetical protein
VVGDLNGVALEALALEGGIAGQKKGREYKERHKNGGDQAKEIDPGGELAWSIAAERQTRPPFSISAQES